MQDALHVVCPRCDSVNRLPRERPAEAGRCGRCHARLFEGEPVALTTARFGKHLRGNDIPVVADFWAAWCGPCRAMAPVFARATVELEPRARFVKIDVDAEPQLAARFGVQGIPALFVFKDGKVAAHQAGLADERLLRGWVEQFAA
jgi:thioredoxin 2